MSEKTIVSKETAKKVFEVLDSVRSFYRDESNYMSASRLHEFGFPLYQELRILLYRTQILDEADSKFVSEEGAEALAAYKPGGASREPRSDELMVDREDLRCVYLIVEDLASYFHQPQHWQAGEDLIKFAGLIRPRLEDVCGRVRGLWFGV